MLDVFGLPSSANGNTQIFTHQCVASTNAEWETWRKPRGTSMVFILCIGGGGGGGGGFTGIAGSARGGAGGGGSSGTTRVLMPSVFLPDTLFVRVGQGGQGVPSGGVSGPGLISTVAVAPSTVVTNVLALSGNVQAVGGGSGTAAVAGTGGNGGTVATLVSMPLAGLGLFVFNAGQLGANGGVPAGANGVAITSTAGGVLAMAGSGGAGTTAADFAGGAVSLGGAGYLALQMPATPAAGSNNGSGGGQIWKPFFSVGGGGGSSSNAGVGGAGGKGAYGAGGGGGGGGTTGGRGGDGGSGIVIITAW